MTSQQDEKSLKSTEGSSSTTDRAVRAAGFNDPRRARALLRSKELAQVDHVTVLEALRATADPDMALLNVIRWLERIPSLAGAVQDPSCNQPLFMLAGASEALVDFVLRHPDQADALTVERPSEYDPSDPSGLRAKMLTAVGADPEADVPIAASAEDATVAALRVAYRAELLDTAMKDVCADEASDSVRMVAAELADLAAAAVDGALAIAYRHVADTYPDTDVTKVRLAVIGMGKCGARELNYVSDVDVIYVHSVAEGADEQTADRAEDIAASLTKAMGHIVGSTGKEPALWELDANLRPEGQDGAMSRTLASHVQYYKRWADHWEFQALLKARPIAGDAALGEEYIEAIWPMVWEASRRDGFVEAVQRMRQRVTDNIPPAEVERQIKLGPGGLRDVEFTVQLLQLVHGRVDDGLRVRGTLEALDALASAAYISRDDARQFSADYRYLRSLEHRIQLVRLRRTHAMPKSEAEQRALARGVAAPGERQVATAEHMLKAWKKIKNRVRGLHQKIFFRPLLAAAAGLQDDEVRLTPGAAEARLKVLGYADPKQAMRHIEALTGGISRTAALQRHLLPVMLEWFADGVSPDAGLLGFRRLSDSLGSTPWFMSMLRDSAAGAERLCRILSTSRMVVDLLEVSPEATAWLGNDADLKPRRWEKLWKQVSAKLDRHEDAADGGMQLVRTARRRETLRVALAHGSGLIDVEELGRALSNVDQAAVMGAWHVARHQEVAEHGELARFAVIAMGRQGGAEIGYGSDLDAMYVYEPVEGVDPEAAKQQANRMASALGHLLSGSLTPPILAEHRLKIDVDLRPEGKNGPLVRSLESYADYYERWAETWERQALLRARPFAGDEEVGQKFIELIDPVRYQHGLSDKELQEIRRVKARVEGERLPRGVNPRRHVKLGPGGLSDVEWLVQSMQLRFAKRHPGLQTTNTLEALRAGHHAGLISQEDAESLETAWKLATDVRAANMACTGRASDSFPSSRSEISAVATWIGWGKDAGPELEEAWLRVARRSRQVFEELFYGEQPR